MNEKHIANLISDYVLELLPPEQQLQVERHLPGCQQCRLALQQERQLGQAVRQTLLAAGRTQRRRLQQLRPAAPRRGFWLAGQQQLAAAALVIMLLLGSWGLSLGRAPHAPAIFAGTGTATATDTPTLTVTATALSALNTAPSQPLLLSTEVTRPAVRPVPVAPPARSAALQTLPED